MVRTRGGKRSVETRDDPQPSTSSAADARDDSRPSTSAEPETRRSALKKQKFYSPEDAAELISILDNESEDGWNSDLDSGESVIGETDEEDFEIFEELLQPSEVPDEYFLTTVTSTPTEIELLQPTDPTSDNMVTFSTPIEIVSEILQPSESTGESLLTLSSAQTKVSTHVGRQRRTRQRLTVPQAPNYSFSADRPSFDDIPFTRNPGLNQSPTVKQPVEYFNMLFTAELKTIVVNETNDFAETKKSGASSHARIRRWKTLTIEEFTLWLGLLIHMGNMVLPRISDYWTTDKLFNLPFVRSVMSRDRFMNILNCLHFHTNPPPQTETDRLYKIRPLIKFFHDIMEKLVTPCRRLCIDESMILWRGRLVFRVYLKGKRHKYGIKLYMLTEPSGLVLRFIVYSGSGDQEVGGQGHVDMVVHKLMEGQLDFGHSLFMDNYYNSVRLAHELLERKTYVTGTLRKNRKNNPPQVVSKKLKKSESTSQFSDSGICVLKWNDRREVLMISSEFSPDLVDVTDRRGRVVQKPEMVAEYNKSMGGIDHMDQLLAYYPIERKCMKWYRKVAIHIFHLILTNSYILFRKDNPSSKMSLYDFRLNLVKSLTAPAFPPPSAPSNIPSVPSNPPSVPSPAPSSQTTTVLHAPRQTPLNDNNRRLFRRCVVCLKSGKRKESSYYCPDCPTKPHLCAPCFRPYHEM